jgi:hypothetical protein
MHGCSTEFYLALAEINACRDNSLNARDWREIEHQLVTRLARPGSQYPEWESWMVAAWLAMQESGRHALLAYLYMVSLSVLEYQAFSML